MHVPHTTFWFFLLLLLVVCRHICLSYVDHVGYHAEEACSSWESCLLFPKLIEAGGLLAGQPAVSAVIIPHFVF